MFMSSEKDGMIEKKNENGKGFMRIRIIRHGEVDYVWGRKLDSEGYDRSCREYDERPIKDSEKRLILAEGEPVFISSLERTFHTAKQVFGEGKVRRSKNFDEVPLRSYKDTEKKHSVWVWNVLARVQWLFNCNRQPEIRRLSQQRARAAIAELEEAGTDCSLVCHRFFMMVLCRELKKAGYKIKKTRMINIKNLDVIEAIK